jgi:fatty acid desaturase
VLTAIVHEQQTGESSWAREQVETSNNFCTHSKLWFILSNGLNFQVRSIARVRVLRALNVHAQIEHHLFPSVNHEHLHKISPIVEATCLEFRGENASRELTS